MVTSSIVQKSQLEGSNRIDAEYYQLEYFIDFTKGKWQSIGASLELCQYGISQAMNDEKKGFPIFKMDDINYGFLFDNEVRFAEISDATLHQFKLEKNDVLFNRVNSEEFVGRTGIYKLADLKSVFASYLIRIRTKENGEILPDYLNIFLNSAYGLKQIRKFARRAVNQANVNAEELKQFKIAILPQIEQEKIAFLSDQSWKAFEVSKSRYYQAENILLEVLGLKDYKIEDDLSFVVNFSGIKSSNRIDPDYFQQKYQKLISKLKTKKSKVLSEVIENIAAKFNPQSVPDKMFKYVELANINSSLGIIDGASEVLGKEAPSRARRVLKEGDVIVSSIGGSLNKIALVDKENEGSLASTGFFQLRSKEILPEVLLVLAKSVVLQMQLEKQVAGTILAAISNESLKNIVIPIIPMETQQKIADLVRQSHESRKKSKELLDEAKRKVEEMIEKGGE